MLIKQPKLLKRQIYNEQHTMRIVFCNIAWMKEYTGNEDGNDPPLNGGSYVQRTGDAHEKYNFTSRYIARKEGYYCLGFFETKSRNGKVINQMHIENIAGCELCKNEEFVEDVLVVYCAKHPAHNFTTVVGWYKHATVFRHYQEENMEGEVQNYNAIAKAEDCVLLPTSARSRILKWTTLGSGTLKKSVYKVNCRIKTKLFKKLQIKYTFN